MNFPLLGSVALRPAAWRAQWALRGQSAQGIAGATRSDRRAEARGTLDARPAAISHRFWHGLLYALPIGIAFWAGVYFLLFT